LRTSLHSSNAPAFTLANPSEAGSVSRSASKTSLELESSGALPEIFDQPDGALEDVEEVDGAIWDVGAEDFPR
jgi:hypothetical protein